MMKVQCPGCQKVLAAKDGLAGRTVKCPACAQLLTIPAAVPEQAPAGPGPGTCPHCQRPRPDGAVQCLYCGLNFLTGQRRPEGRVTPLAAELPAELAEVPKRRWQGLMRIGLPVGCLLPVLVALGILLYKLRVIGPDIRAGDSFSQVLFEHVEGPKGWGQYPDRFLVVPGALKSFTGSEEFLGKRGEEPSTFVTENPAWHYLPKPGSGPEVVKQKSAGGKTIVNITRCAKPEAGQDYPGVVFQAVDVSGYREFFGRSMFVVLEVEPGEGCVPLPSGRVICVNLSTQKVTRVLRPGGSLWVRAPKLLEGRAFVGREARYADNPWSETGPN